MAQNIQKLIAETFLEMANGLESGSYGSLLSCWKWPVFNHLAIIHLYASLDQFTHIKY